MSWLAADFETDVADGLLVGELGWLFFFILLMLFWWEGLLLEEWAGAANTNRFAWRGK